MKVTVTINVFSLTVDNVHYQNAAQLMKLLTEAGTQFELQVIYHCKTSLEMQFNSLPV